MRSLSSEGKSKNRKGLMSSGTSSSSMSSLGGGVGAREGTMDGAIDDEGVEFDEGTAALFAEREVIALDLRGFAMVQKVRIEGCLCSERWE